MIGRKFFHEYFSESEFSAPARRRFLSSLLPGVLACGVAPLLAQEAKAARRQLPLSTIFKGQSKFDRVVAKARKENWRKLPIGERVGRFANEFHHVPYKGFTLEIDDRVESPSVNLLGLDCWTFFEISLGLARMIAWEKDEYNSGDLLREIELTRYRAGRCTGNYLERIHYLAEWFFENEARGTCKNITRELGGAERLRGRKIQEMTVLWKSYRYLRENPDLRPKMKEWEDYVASLPVYYIPKSKVARIEGKLQNGDVLGIATKHDGGFCSHVGVAMRTGDGVMRMMHASTNYKKVVYDKSVSGYLNQFSSHQGLIVGRPLEVSETVTDPEVYKKTWPGCGRAEKSGKDYRHHGSAIGRMAAVGAGAGILGRVHPRRAGRNQAGDLPDWRTPSERLRRHRIGGAERCPDRVGQPAGFRVVGIFHRRIGRGLHDRGQGSRSLDAAHPVNGRIFPFPHEMDGLDRHGERWQLFAMQNDSDFQPSDFSFVDRRDWLKAACLTAGSGALLSPSPARAAAADGEERNYRFALNMATIMGQKLDAAQEIEVAAKAGYDAIEPWFRNLNKYVEDGGSLKDLRKRIDDHGLTVESAIGFAAWISDDDEKRAKGFEEVKRDMDTLAELGGIRMAAPPAGVPRGESVSLDAAAERYRQLLELGDEMGVIPQIEMWGGNATIGTVEKAVYIAVASGHPKACFLGDATTPTRGGVRSIPS